MKKLVLTILVGGTVLGSNSKDAPSSKNDDKQTRVTQFSDDKTVVVFKDTNPVTTRTKDLMRIETTVASGTNPQAKIKWQGKLITKRAHHPHEQNELALDHFKFEIQPQAKGMITVVVNKTPPGSTKPEKT